MCAHCISLGVQKMDVKDCLLVLGGLVRDVEKEPAMSEFKEPKIGDKIVIPEGFILVGFNGDYKKVYEVADFFFDNKHGMHFITFEADGRNYTFPPAAFDKASDAEIKAGQRIDNDMGDDSHIENHISPLCEVKDHEAK